MSKLNYQQIRMRIENEIGNLKASVWAKKVGVNPNVVTNIHGKVQQNPSLGYIVSVALATGKPVDYFLFGDESQTIYMKTAVNDGTTTEDPIIQEHFEIVKQFEDKITAKELNSDLLRLEQLDRTALRELHEIIKIKLKMKGAEELNLKGLAVGKKAVNGK